MGFYFIRRVELFMWKWNNRFEVVIQNVDHTKQNWSHFDDLLYNSFTLVILCVVGFYSNCFRMKYRQIHNRWNVWYRIGIDNDDMQISYILSDILRRSKTSHMEFNITFLSRVQRKKRSKKENEETEVSVHCMFFGVFFLYRTNGCMLVICCMWPTSPKLS